MQEKRGVVHHLEMIISFVFFVGFTFFLFIILKPYNVSTLDDTVSRSIYMQLKENINIEITEFTLSVDGTEHQAHGGTCIVISMPYLNSSYGLNTIFLYDPSQIIKSKIDTGALYLTKGDEGNGFTLPSYNYRIRASLSFAVQPSLSGCNPISDDKKTIGALNTYSIASYEKLLLLKQAYDSNYEAVKTSLKIPSVFEFSITSSDLPAEVQMTKEPPSNIEVKAEEYLLSLYKNGEIINARFIIKTW